MATTQVSAIEDMRQQAALIESALKILNKRIDDIESTTMRRELNFDEETLSISWNGGRTNFRKGAAIPFAILNVLYEAPDRKLSHAEVAEIVLGNEFAPVYQTAYRLAHKLRRCGCPFQLGIDRENFWLF